MKSRCEIRAALSEIDMHLRCHLRDRAYLIGSSAACLAGAAVEALDIDLMTSDEDAVRLEEAWAANRVTSHLPADDHLFRSRFSRYVFTSVPVEIMGGLQVFYQGEWRAVEISSTVELVGYSPLLLMPTVDEQLRILDMFGRAKDARRAGLLRRVKQTTSSEQVNLL